MAQAILKPKELTALLARALEERALEPGPPFPCPYLPGREARQVVVRPSPLVPGLYHSFMELNFRRSGPIFYRPACDACAECRMLRVLVDEFRPTRAQRRAIKQNQGLDVTIAAPQPSEEKRRLYARYLAARHDGQLDGSPDEFTEFLYASPLRTLEFEYREDGRLLAAAIADLEPGALSAVYCYFDPAEARRSLGVFNVLFLIGECRRRGLPHLYLGYFVRGSRKMAYKAGYRPCEVLRPDGLWERGVPPVAAG